MPIDHTQNTPEYGQKSLDLREGGAHDPLSIRAEEIQDRVHCLLEVGLSPKVIESIRSARPTLYHKEMIYEKIG